METRSGIPLGTKPTAVEPISWNEDGQLLFCLPDIVRIVIPSLVDVTQESDPYNHIGVRPLSEIPPGNYGDTTIPDRPVQSAILVPEQYRAATWSPTGLSATDGCLLTVLTNKHRVIHYGPSATRKGAPWSPVIDMTESIKDKVLDGEDSTFTDHSQVMSFHTLACAWSGTIYPNPLAEKAAILALANKAGEIALWMYLPSTGFRYLTCLPVHNEYCIMLKWTRWRVHNGKHEAYIVSTGSLGTLCLTKVTIDVGESEEKTTVQSVDALVMSTWFEDNRSTIDKISIYDDWDQGTVIRIAVAKAAQVVVGQVDVMDNTKATWSKYWLDDSTMAPAGMEWAEGAKELRILTMEGQGLVLQTADATMLSLDIEATRDINTKLVVRITQQWDEEQANMDQDAQQTGSDVRAVVYGCATSTGGLFTAYLFGFLEDVDSIYYENDVNLSWMAFMLHKERNDKEFIAKLIAEFKQKISDPPFFFTYPYKSLLHEPLEYLVDDDDADGTLGWIKCMESVMMCDIPDITGSLEKRVYFDSRATAARALVRTRLELVRYELQGDGEQQLVILDETARMFVKMQFSNACLAYLIDLPDDDLERLEDDDVDTVLLLCDRILQQVVVLPFTIDTIQKALKRIIPWAPTYTDSLNEEIERSKQRLGTNEPVEMIPREHCPACKQHDKLVMCPTGHIWETCSMTGRALATPVTRVCVHCDVKSLLPTGETLIDKMLQRCKRCIMCGSVLS